MIFSWLGQRWRPARLRCVVAGRALLCLCLASLYACAGTSSTAASDAEGSHGLMPKRPNILVITVDDMNADSVGAFGSRVADITPNIDAFARQGMRFEYAHVQVANCMPSRNVMWSGLYPHTSGIEGFVPVANPEYQTLGDTLQAAGYFTAIRHKLKDSTPYTPFPWDRVLDHQAPGGKPNKKDARSYGASVAEGIASAKAENKPFFLLINVADPHVPFYGLNKKGEPIEDKYIPSRIYGADEVEVPASLPDVPAVREELAHYFSSVRRADDAVGEVLDALARSGAAANTLVMFVSDHGMPFPFAKTQLYHRSTHTPLVVRWPARIQPGSVDNTNMVSAIDFMPTLLEAAGVALPAGLQGRSFLELFAGKGGQRDHVIKEYNQNAGWQRAPMRAVQSKRYLYVFNAWADGERVLRSATLNTQAFKAMKALAETDERMAARVNHLLYRSVEEFYDIQNDPDCLHNLIEKPQLGAAIDEHRTLLKNWMARTQDHAQEAFLGRAEPAALERYMRAQTEAASAQAIWYKHIRQSMKSKRQ